MPTPRKPGHKQARPSASTNAIELLKADHAEVKQLFEEYDALVESEADDDAKKGLVENICTMLTAHSMIEEEIFYPAAREALDEGAVMDEADVEHAGAKDLIEQIQGMEPDEPLYDAKVKVLGEYIVHHVKEEEGEMFPQVQKAGLDLNELGAEMAGRKEEILESIGAEAPH